MRAITLLDGLMPRSHLPFLAAVVRDIHRRHDLLKCTRQKSSAGRAQLEELRWKSSGERLSYPSPPSSGERLGEGGLMEWTWKSIDVPAFRLLCIGLFIRPNGPAVPWPD